MTLLVISWNAHSKFNKKVAEMKYSYIFRLDEYGYMMFLIIQSNTVISHAYIYIVVIKHTI